MITEDHIRKAYEVDMRHISRFRDYMDALAFRVQTLIRIYAPRKTGLGADNIMVEYNEEKQSLEVTSRYKYMWYLEYGYKGFVMRALAGKTIPIKLPDGRILFRKATLENIGRHRISKRDPLTGQILSGNVPYTWQHPGQKPLKFIERSLAQAREEFLPALAKTVADRSIPELFVLVNRGDLA